MGIWSEGGRGEKRGIGDGVGSVGKEEVAGERRVEVGSESVVEGAIEAALADGKGSAEILLEGRSVVQNAIEIVWG